MARAATPVLTAPLFDNDNVSTFEDSADDFMDMDFGSESLSSLEDSSDDMSLDGGTGQELKVHEVSFTVKSVDNLLSYQETIIRQTAAILGLTESQSVILLRSTKWNKDKLFEQYRDPADMAILPSSNQREIILAKNLPPNQQPFICSICCGDDQDMETVGVACEHRFCIDCYRDYLSQKINQGETRPIECPDFECTAMVDDTTIDNVVDEPTMTRYQRFLLNTFVDDHDSLRWCPAADCNHIVECHIPTSSFDFIVPTVQCTCGHSFCFSCGELDHRPVTCDLVNKWMAISSDSPKTINWILANTKECPKCHAIIQKNGGCDHMTCRRCNHGFCWVCFGAHHMSKCTGTPSPEVRNKIRTRQQQEQALENYDKHKKHFKSFEDITKVIPSIYKAIASNIAAVQKISKKSWIGTDFLTKAVYTLVECRHTLKWSIVLHYYLAETNEALLFGYNLSDLESAAEELSRLLDSPLDATETSQWRMSILDKAAYVKQRRDTLLEDTAKSLLDGTWSFDTSEKW